MGGYVFIDESVRMEEGHEERGIHGRVVREMLGRGV